MAFTSHGMELRRCSHVCRKDRIKQHMEAKDHVFDKPQEDDEDFPKREVEHQKIRTIERMRQLVLEHTARAVINLGISLNKATQCDLWNFCTEMIRIGQNLANQQLELDEAMVSFSRNILTEKVLEIGRKLKLRDTEMAREMKFVNIAVDAGTVLGKGVVHSILTNPYSEHFPILLEISDNDGYDKFKYKQLFGFLTLQCKKECLTVCSICTDGLRAQRMALEELIGETEDAYVRAIVPLHCLAHVTQLVFVDLVKQSPHIKRTMQDIHELATLLRKPRVTRELGEKCPSLCQTRWLYIVDVLMWLYARKDKITAFLLASDNNETDWEQLPREWKELLVLLMPLKRLSLCMESSDCGLWEVIPIVESVLNAWKKVLRSLSEEGLHALRIILTNLIIRFSRVAPATIAAAFALSEIGRDELRRREEGFQTRGAHSTCYATDRIELMKTLFDNIDQELSSENLKSLGPAEDQNVGDEESVETAPTNADGFLFINPDDDEEDDDEMRTTLLRLSIDALLTSTIFEFNFSVVSDELVRMGEILCIEPDYIRERLRVWLFAPREETPTCHDVAQSPDTIWRRVPANSEDWRSFAELALRFVTISTSEADCERMLSRQRDLQGLRTSSIRTELLDARLRT